MKIKFLGASKTVTGSKHLLEIKNKKILIDSGMFQGDGEEEYNKVPLEIEPNKIDLIILTHAHYDHCGYLPILYKNGCKAPVFSTKLTRDIAEIVLTDSVQIQEVEDGPIFYKEEDVLDTLNHFQFISFEKETVWNDIKIVFHRAGHILGASFVTLEAEGKKILFSGDIGNPDDILMPSPMPMPKVDYAIVESTYGDRDHDIRSLDEELDYFLSETFSKQKVWLIPSFAVARTQNIFYKLHQHLQKLKIDIPIFMNSPMGRKVSDLYYDNASELKVSTHAFKEAYDYVKFSQWPKELKKLDTVKGPAIIISSSGMLEGGRILRALKYHGREAGNLLTFVGYQGEGTLGRRILDGEREFALPDKENFVLAADVFELKGLSAHADRNQIADWILKNNQDTKIILVHGNSEVQDSFKECLSKKGIEAITSYQRDAVELA